MTSTPGTTSATADLQACLDRLGELDLTRLEEPEHAELLRTVGSAVSRLSAFRMALIRNAESAGLARKAGLASTGQWTANATNADSAAAEREARLAHDLARLSLTEQALSCGTISTEHAAVIVEADRQLPAAVTPGQREVVETALLGKARDLTPGALRKAARRAVAAIEPDPVVVDAHEDGVLAAEERLARSRTRLTLHDNGDGTMTGRFTLPTLQGQLLRKILETMTAPRRGRLGASQAQAGENTGDDTDWGRARGEAFGELIEHLPTEYLHPRTAATLVVTLNDDTMRGALRAGHLDTGESLSSGEVRRLLCGAGLVPAVLGGQSLPLDLGRSSRLFTEPQRTALGLTHSSCAADGCDRPFAWCELHHRDPWGRGGQTNLADAIPLCHFHHQRIHDRDYQHRFEPDGSVTFRRRW
ncbi:MAG: DUF222 domain-containing protein [Propionibacteriales bacterium]|nr:DUF222 domain-containing protein [Propionibacteriales bacterium]